MNQLLVANQNSLSDYQTFPVDSFPLQIAFLRGVTMRHGQRQQRVAKEAIYLGEKVTFFH